MSDEDKNYTFIQSASGSELSFTYNADNITIVQLLYQLDEAKKNKDSDAFEDIVEISEAVFLQDKFNRLPLEDRMRFENLIEDQVDLKDRFYEFKDEVIDEHFPEIHSELESYRGLFKNARNEIYESKQLAENNELELEKLKAKEEYKSVEAQSNKERWKRRFGLVEKIGGVAVINFALFGMGFAVGAIGSAQTANQFPEHANSIIDNNTLSYISGSVLAIIGDYIMLSNWINNK